MHELGTALRELVWAQWSERLLPLAGCEAPRRDLESVVCREGDPGGGRHRKAIPLRMRYSHHFRAAFPGETFALTPSGWAGCFNASGRISSVGNARFGYFRPRRRRREWRGRRIAFAGPLVREGCHSGGSRARA